jgi:hypothetical protein
VTIAAIIGALAVLACSAGYAAKQQRTPPGSFLRYRATTVQDLANQVTRDPVVRARFAKHFKRSPDSLAADIANEIKLVTLKSPVRVTAYYISRSGRISSKQKLLPRGTLVFADSKGTPIMAWSCGNPLTTAIPRRVVKQVPKPLEEAKPMVEEIPQVAPPAPAPTDMVASAPEEVFAPVAEPLAVAPAAAEVIPPTFVPSVLAGAAIMLPAFAAVIPATGGEKEIHPPEVPEPGATAALAAGLMSLAGAVRIRRRR